MTCESTKSIIPDFHSVFELVLNSLTLFKTVSTFKNSYKSFHAVVLEAVTYTVFKGTILIYLLY